MKRIFALLLIVATVLVLMPACADEEAVELVESSEGLSFKLNEDEASYTLVGIGTCTAENVVIDGYEGYPVTEIAKSALAKAKNIKSITIGNSVTEVGEVAFYACEKLSSVNFGKSVTRIGKNAFEKCVSLETIVIPDGIKEIAMRTFSGCTALKNVTIGKDVTDIRGYAFENCTALNTVTIPAAVKYVRDYSFLGCTGLVEVINYSAVKIEKGSDKNGGIAYYALDVHVGESKLVNKGDFVFYPGETNYLVEYTGNSAEVVLPDDFEGEAYAIAPYAFCDNTKISSVKLGKKTFAMGNNVFAGATALSKVDLGTEIIAIGAEAFSGCVALDNIAIPESVQGIGVGAFKNCTAIEEISITKNVKIIGKNAFEGCSGLKSADFVEKTGWKAGGTEISAEDLADKTKAAEYLTKTYLEESWGK